MTAALICAGRFKACHARLTNEEWSVVIGSGTDVFGGITPEETKYSSWLELVQAVVESGYEYNEEITLVSYYKSRVTVFTMLMS